MGRGDTMKKLEILVINLDGHIESGGDVDVVALHPYKALDEMFLCRREGNSLHLEVCIKEERRCYETREERYNKTREEEVIYKRRKKRLYER